MAISYYAEGVAACLLLLTVSVITQDDQEDYLLDNYQIAETDPPELNEFVQNVLNHKDDFRWIERYAERVHLPNVGRYDKDIEQKFRVRQFSDRNRRKPENDVGYSDYAAEEEEEEEEDEGGEDVAPRIYRRVPGGFHDRLRRRHRLLNRSKRGVNSDIDYDYDSDVINGVQVSPQSEYGVRNVPGNKYGYNSKRKFRRYLHRNGYLPSPYFSNNDQSAMVIDDTVVPTHHDILGLKKYRERNRKKVAERQRKSHRKRSIYLLDAAPLSENVGSDLKANAIPYALEQNQPCENLSKISGPYANIINTAVLGIQLPSSIGNITNTEIPFDENSKGNCAVKPPVNSHFEGLMYPSIQEIVKSMSNSIVSTAADQESTTPLSESLFVVKSAREVLQNPTTVHVNSLYDVTHPTSAIEQRVLGASDNTFDDVQENEPISTTSTSGATPLEAAGEVSLDPYDSYNHKENEDNFLFEGIQRNAFRVKGTKPKKEDIGKKTKLSFSRKSYDDNVSDEDYYYEQNKLDEMPDEEDLDSNRKRQQPLVNEPPPFYLREKPFYHSRQLLNLDSEMCKDDSLCSIKKKRGLPDLFGMSNEEDYKDDDTYSKQILKMSNSEGEDDDGGGDPYIGKKLKFETKKKENESKDEHVVDIPEDDSTSAPISETPPKIINKIQIAQDRTSTENDDKNFRLCGTGKNKIYCDMKGEKEDDGFSHNTQIDNSDYKRKSTELKNYLRENQISSNKENKQGDYYIFVASNKPITDNWLDHNEKTMDKEMKPVQVVQTVNPLQKESNERKQPYKESVMDDTDDLPSQTPKSESPILISRNIHDNQASFKIREESNQDVIEAGFKRKSIMKNYGRQKRRHKTRSYLDRLRLNNYRKNQQHGYHKPPKFSVKDFGETIPQPLPKYKINFLEPSDDNIAYIRKARSFKEKQNIDYSLLKQIKRGELLGADPSVFRAIRNATELSLSTEVATEIYPENLSKPSIEYIEYQKESTQQATSNLSTEIAASVVDQIFEAINANSNLGATLGKGLCKQSARQKNIEDLTNIDKNSTKTDLKDTQNLLDSLMVAINKIIEEKVKARLCRKLPPPLNSYLKTIVKISKPPTHESDASSAENLPLPQIKAREAVEDHPDAEQSDFLFYKEGNETPEIKKRQIKFKMRIIRSLLQEYEQMSGKCKVKMRFVRDYLEKNLVILEALLDRCEREDILKHSYPHISLQQKQIKKKHTAHPKGPKTEHNNGSREPIDEQLQKIGWETRKGKLLADSDVDKILRQSLGKEKRDTHSDLNEKRTGSKQYKALVEAAEKARQKHEKEEKLAKLFGQKRSGRSENYETIKSRNKEMQELGPLNFEEPMVFSMDN